LDSIHEVASEESKTVDPNASGVKDAIRDLTSAKVAVLISKAFALSEEAEGIEPDESQICRFVSLWRRP
jgi:hypothetical protein